MLSMLIFTADISLASDLTWYRHQAAEKMADLAYYPFKQLAEANRVNFFDDEKNEYQLAVHAQSDIIAQRYLGTEYADLTLWMKKWLNLGIMYNEGLPIVFSEPQMPYYLIQAEIQNLFGVNNLFLVTNYLEIIREWQNIEQKELLALIEELDENLKWHHKQHQSFSGINPANNIFRAAVYFSLLDANKTIEANQEFLELIMTELKTANSFFETSGPFLGILEQIYSHQEQKDYFKQYLSSFEKAMPFNEQQELLESLGIIEDLRAMCNEFFINAVEFIVAEYPDFALETLQLDGEILSQIELEPTIAQTYNQQEIASFVIKELAPTYPKYATAEKKEAVIILRAYIDAHGNLIKIKFLASALDVNFDNIAYNTLLIGAQRGDWQFHALENDYFIDIEIVFHPAKLQGEINYLRSAFLP